MPSSPRDKDIIYSNPVSAARNIETVSGTQNTERFSLLGSGRIGGNAIIMSASPALEVETNGAESKRSNASLLWEKRQKKVLQKEKEQL